MAARAAAATDALLAADGSGLLASTVLLSGAAPGAPDDAPVRLVHLIRWLSSTHADAAGPALALDAGLRQVLVGRSVHDLDVHGVVTGSGSARCA